MNQTRIKRSIFLFVLFFVVLGLLIVYDVGAAQSLSLFNNKFSVVSQQCIRAIVGIVALLVASKIPSKVWRTIGPFLFGLSLVLLCIVLLPHVSPPILGAKRWIGVGSLVFQPSELAKLGLIFYLSVWLQKPKLFRSFALLLTIVFGLVMLEPDLGSGLVLSAIALSMYFVAGKPLKHLVWLFGAGAVGIILLILVSPYRFNRLTTFLNPDSDPQGKSYHIRQITIALGNGGVFGQGIGKSRQKYQYIPEATTDSIFAIVAEEIGFIGCGMIIIGYITLYTQMNRFAVLLTDPTEALIATGIIAWLVSQTLVNLASIVALIPLTGVPLPFISYGGSALITTLLAVGILLSLGKEKEIGRKR
ncbi:stage V sporulation protein E [Candidatus Cerribacteria bacterium 'Amazon FNV 2010 28 9']|uniref:Probable peptidoglycan glycosyltransferase FtsW n=1 Tax=Candidatus Cerribacteria bacterium 'Amazon FNV 2010 28 9' TaxID=2081795 RepID=A0A317JR56_9BACT|nr:MAG: stage V sporulation protein E [Candidatus Cerribacteria bacterium 'Amazon FNV 2010 28 9']